MCCKQSESFTIVDDCDVTLYITKCDVKKTEKLQSPGFGGEVMGEAL